MMMQRERERENALFVTTVSCTFCLFHEKFQKISVCVFLNFFLVCVFFVDETDLPVFSL